MKKITPELIDAMLLQQDLEFRTDFNSTNHLLYSTINDAPEPELMAAGEQLIGSDVASRRILGIRLLRELKQFAQRATSDLAELLSRELDDEVIYWIISAFGFLKSDSVTDQITIFATHKNSGIRYHLATALANRAADELPLETTAALIALSNDVNAEVRFSAVFELGAWWQINHDSRIETALNRALSDDDSLVVRAAREALAEGSE